MKRLTEEQKKSRVSYRRFVIFNGTEITEGGWYRGRKWMTAKYLTACVRRWVMRSYDTGKEQPDYAEEIPHQCGGCRWFAVLDSDYGFCCNPQSPNEGRITFEHGGCKEHSYYHR